MYIHIQYLNNIIIIPSSLSIAVTEHHDIFVVIWATGHLYKYLYGYTIIILYLILTRINYTHIYIYYYLSIHTRVIPGKYQILRGPAPSTGRPSNVPRTTGRGGL